jgi:hypothetical protein
LDRCRLSAFSHRLEVWDFLGLTIIKWLVTQKWLLLFQMLLVLC